MRPAGLALWLGLFAVVLCLPSLRYGLQGDDHLLPWRMAQGAEAWNLFQLEAESVPAARERGELVWWSNPALECFLLRPLASLTHALDFTLWPDAAWLMRLFNALLYGGAVALAAALYRRLAPSLTTASLAALLFAVDDAHAASVGWIASRNTLLAVVFALSSLLLHLRARERPGPARELACAACVALALASGEAGVWSLALLISHALVLDSDPPIARLRALRAPLFVGLAWVALYLTLEAGFRGASFYREPSAAALVQGALDVPVWFVDLVGLSGFPFLAFPTEQVRWAALPVALVLVSLLLPGLRRSRECRFFALACVSCLAPLAFTLPNSRVLLGPSFGALGWIACSIAAGWASGGTLQRSSAGFLLVLHVGMGGLAFVPGLGGTQSLAYGTAQIVGAVESGREVVLLQSPLELLGNFALAAIDTSARPAAAPRRLHQLYTGSSELWIERIDARTLDVEAGEGWGRTPVERLFCAPERMPRAGSEVRLQAFAASVLQSDAHGMPRRVRFRFPTALESAERQWLAWVGNRVVPWTPPQQGQRVRVAALALGRALQPDPESD